jgi:hypothetical protein
MNNDDDEVIPPAQTTPKHWSLKDDKGGTPLHWAAVAATKRLRSLLAPRAPQTIKIKGASLPSHEPSFTVSKTSPNFFSIKQPA